MNAEHGILFPEEYQKHLKAQFCYADADPLYGPRLFFENSGGSLRLRAAVEAKAACEQFPDCPERNYARGLKLAHYVSEGTKEILEVVFGAKSGALVTELSASQTMFQIVDVILALTLGFSDSYYSTFTYNESSKLYYKQHSGEDHRDARTTKQLCFTNVFVLETDVSVRDSVGRLDVGWQGGSGWYVSHGGVEPITWEKADEYSNLVFYNGEGARLKVNPGKSYLGFLPAGETDFR